MLTNLCVLLLCLFLLAAGGCGSSGQQPAQTNAAQPQPSPTAANVCPLVQNSEIEAIQGAKVSSVQPSARPDQRFSVSQCYYTVISADGTKNLSVHLEVTRGSAPGSLKDFWEERFGGEEREEKGEREKERERERERKGEKEKKKVEKGKEAEKGKEREEEEEESTPPLRVEGVGEEAFWLGSPKAGALYVLKGESMVRVSVGGGDDMNTKIEKSKKLAAAVLKRL